MASIFTRILVGELPGRIVAQDNAYFAILDIRPQMPGHTLVIPKREESYIFNLDEQTYTGLLLFCKKLAPLLQQVTDAKRIGMAVEGFGVPHVHVHLVPMHEIEDLKRPHYEASENELDDMERKIKDAVKESGLFL